MFANLIRFVREGYLDWCDRREATLDVLRELGRSTDCMVAETMKKRHADLYRGAVVVERDLSTLERRGQVRRVVDSHDLDTDERVFYEVIA